MEDIERSRISEKQETRENIWGGLRYGKIYKKEKITNKRVRAGQSLGESMWKCKRGNGMQR